MSLGRNILMRMFGRPRGVLGKLGGLVMARTNAGCGAWVAGLLEVEPDDRILEVGFGPGMLVRRLADLASTGQIAGVDPSPEMVAQARAQNAAAIVRGQVDLRPGSVENLPFADDSFDNALAINSMQVWPDALVGLREVRRVLKPGGRVALGFTSYSGQKSEGLTEKLTAAGFVRAQMVRRDKDFCVLASKP
jgi:ubiquinone/menaquinone biosynthesis C-methylase UbiE